MKSYLLVFDDTQISRDRVVDVIDGIEMIVNWLAFFNGAIMLVSDASAPRIAKRLRKDLPDIRFIVVEMQERNKGGLLPKRVWEFMNNPKPAGE